MYSSERVLQCGRLSAVRSRLTTQTTEKNWISLFEMRAQIHLDHARCA